MSKEIVINKGKQTRIAIVENGELAELFIENQEHERTIGNIFLGRVRRVMPSIQAAFVDIGQKQDAFLHFSDLIENVESWMGYVKEDAPVIGEFDGNYTTRPAGKKRRHPSGQSDSRGRRDSRSSGHHVADKDSANRRKSAQQRQHGRHEARRRDDDRDSGPTFDPTMILKKDQPVLVKISKEPIANKGSRITTDISLAGRFLVLVPMANYVAVSKKIMSFKERRRLRALARSLLPEGFGVIVRTVADGRSAKALDTDLNLLVSKWNKLEERLKTRPAPPSVVHEDVNMASSIMRDLFTEDYDRILIDDQKLYRNIKGYVQAIAPDMVADVHFDDTGQSVFEKVGIAQAVEEAFQDRVNLPSGGYLFIEQTEAMHVIDVNSGRAGRGLSQEENSLRVNLESARVLCKQVRLRDLGGIIVVDFIDMRHEQNRRKVYECLRREFRGDRAVTKVLTMSDFGLIQITRQRLRPSITKTFSLEEGDPMGTSEGGSTRVRTKIIEPSYARVEPQELLTKIEDWIGEYKKSGLSGKVRLRVHPFTASFLNGRFPSQTVRWALRFGVRVKIDSDSKMDPMSFRFLDGKAGKDITRLPKPKPKASRAKPKASRDRDEKTENRSGRNERKGRSSGGSRNKAEGKAGDDRGRGRGGRTSDSRSERSGDNRKRESSDSRDRGQGQQSRGSGNARNADSRRDDSRRKDSRRDDPRRSDARGSEARGGEARGGEARSDDSRSQRQSRSSDSSETRQGPGTKRSSSGRSDRRKPTRTKSDDQVMELDFPQQESTKQRGSSERDTSSRGRSSRDDSSRGQSEKEPRKAPARGNTGSKRIVDQEKPESSSAPEAVEPKKETPPKALPAHFKIDLRTSASDPKVKEERDQKLPEPSRKDESAAKDDTSQQVVNSEGDAKTEAGTEVEVEVEATPKSAPKKAASKKAPAKKAPSKTATPKKATLKKTDSEKTDPKTEAPKKAASKTKASSKKAVSKTKAGAAEQEHSQEPGDMVEDTAARASASTKAGKSAMSERPAKKAKPAKETVASPKGKGNRFQKFDFRVDTNEDAASGDDLNSEDTPNSDSGAGEDDS